MTAHKILIAISLAGNVASIVSVGYVLLHFYRWVPRWIIAVWPAGFAVSCAVRLIDGQWGWAALSAVTVVMAVAGVKVRRAAVLRRFEREGWDR